MSTATLDVYILKKTIYMWIAFLVALCMLVMISMFFGDISMFIQHNTDLKTMLSYMAFSLPQVIFMVLPFSVCLAILATQASLSKHSEIIAMEASAIPWWRILMPFTIIAVLTTIIMMLFSFELYPLSQKKADKIEDIFIKKRDVKGSFTLLGGRFKLGDTFYFVEHMDIRRGTMDNLVCYTVKDGRLTRIARIAHARWDGTIWHPTGMKVIMLGTEDIKISKASGFALKKGPEDLVMASPRPDVLTIGQLRSYLVQLRADGIYSSSLETTYYDRISFAMSPFVMAVLALPFGIRFPRTGGIARGMALGIVLGLSYWGTHYAMVSLGKSGSLSPAVATWMTNVIALAIGMVILFLRRNKYG